MEGLRGGLGDDDDDDEEESEDESDSFSDEGVSVPGVVAGSSSRWSRLRSRWSDGLCGWISIWQRGGGNADGPCGGWE